MASFPFSQLSDGGCLGDAVIPWSAPEVTTSLTNNKLRKANLSHSSFSEKELGDILMALKGNTSCQVLVFRKTRVQDSLVEHLAEVLKVNTALRHLDLSRTGITAPGVLKLANALFCNSTLQSLNLIGNAISDDGVHALVAVARRSTTLKSITVSTFLWDLLGWGPSTRVRAQAVLDEALAAPPLTYLTSNYSKAYEMSIPVESIGNVGQVYEGVGRIMRLYLEQRATCLPVEQATQVFMLRLSTAVSMNCSTAIKPCHTAAAIWTSAESIDRTTFYGAVQHILREDKEGPLLDEVARFSRTLNAALVNRSQQDLAKIPWPASLTTFRGTWMPYAELTWFRMHINQDIRIMQYFATSEKEDTAREFIQEFAPNQRGSDGAGLIPVLMRVHIHAERHCKHVMLLEPWTTSRGEAEWLFQQYSAFKVKTVGPNHPSDVPALHHGPVVIELEAAPDNRDAEISIPVARWS